MTLLQLQYFQVLAHALHYTRTAEQLHISQPSLSYAIKELEKELGIALFQTDHKKVSLTLAGRQFLPYVEQALSLLSKGSELLRQISQDSAPIVRLGYFHSVSASLIPALVDGFYRKNPDSRIRFQFLETASYDVLSQLKSGAIDLGFSLHYEEWVESVGVVRQPLYLAVPVNHPLSSRQFVTFSDFAYEPQIMLERGSNLRTNMEHLFSQHGIVPSIVFEVRECNAALQYVGLGFGVSVLPQVPAMENDKVAIIPISNQEKEFLRTVNLTYPKITPMSPAAQQVRDYIIENFSLKS